MKEQSTLFTHKELIEQCKLGDRKMQYELYSLYVDAMFNVCIRFVKIKEDAEDIIQDSFVDAFKNLGSFKFQSTFGFWLKRIVINKSINFLKVNRLVLTDSNEYDLWVEEPIEEIDYAFEVVKVKKAINSLPLGYQTVINLFLIEGYSHKEIGDILEISSATSKSQYHRAKKKLLQLINEL